MRFGPIQRKATLIYLGLMGVITVEVSEFEVQLEPHAQFPESLVVRCTERGKRKRRGLRYTDDINLVAVDGSRGRRRRGP